MATRIPSEWRPASAAIEPREFDWAVAGPGVVAVHVWSRAIPVERVLDARIARIQAARDRLADRVVFRSLAIEATGARLALARHDVPDSVIGAWLGVWSAGRLVRGVSDCGTPEQLTAALSAALYPAWRPTPPAVTGHDLEVLIASPGLVAVHVWAPWNGVDRSFDAALAPLRAEFADLVAFRALDVDTIGASDVLARHGCTCVPWLGIWSRGRLLGHVAGYRPTRALRAALRAAVARADSHA